MGIVVSILGGCPPDVAALAELLRAAGAEASAHARVPGEVDPRASLVLLDHALLADGGAPALQRVRERHPAAQVCLFAPFAHRLLIDDAVAAALWDTLFLPAQEQDVADLVARTEAFLSRTSRGARRKRILVVDDEPSIREASSALLAGQGLDADTAVDALEAIGKLHLQRYDLVITDLQMPGMDGVALLGKVRAAYPLLPVVLSTGYATVETAVAALRTGAVDFLRKPFTAEDFTQVVERALRYGELARANVELEELARAEKLRLRERQYELRVLAEAIAGLSQAVQPSQVAEIWLRAACRVVDFSCAAFLAAYPEPELVVLDPEAGPGRAGELLERLCREAPGLIGAGGPAGVRIRRIGGEPGRAASAPEAAGAHALVHVMGPPLHPCAAAVTMHAAGAGPTPAQESFLRSLTTPAAQVLEKLRAQAEEERQREAAMVAGMHQGVVLADPAGRVLVINRAARELLALGAKEAVRSLAGLQAARGVPLDDAAAELLASGAETLSREFALAAPAERILTLDLTAIRGEAPEPIAVVALLRDITELRETERMKSEFVTIVSHELRTPLTTIKNCHSLLAGAAGEINPAQQRFLRMAQASVDRIMRLVDDLLDVARIESGGLALQRAAVDLAALLRGVGDEVEYLLLERGQRLVYTGLDAPLPIEADRERLQQVFFNLVHNAVKFSPDGAAIEVRAAAVAAEDLPPSLVALLPAPADGFVEVQVIDEGPGIAPEDLERIFERFQQAETTLRREHGGIGLGLSICRGIVRSHGGAIRAERREGGGSVFRVVLPRGAQPASPGVAESATPGV